MDYGTAKTLSLIGLIFIGIQLAIGSLLGLIVLLQLVFFGALALGADGQDTSGLVCLCFLMFLPLVFLVVPVINFILARGIHRSIQAEALDDRDKTKIIWVIVLSFLGGGGVVPGVMFIVILATWDELTGRPVQRFH